MQLNSVNPSNSNLPLLAGSPPSVDLNPSAMITFLLYAGLCWAAQGQLLILGGWGKGGSGTGKTSWRQETKGGSEVQLLRAAAGSGIPAPFQTAMLVSFVF